MEEVRRGRAQGSCTRGEKAVADWPRFTTRADRLAQRSAGAWFQCRPVDAAPRGNRHRTHHRCRVPSRTRLENTGRDELDRAKAGAASQGAEPRASRLLEDGALACGKKNAVCQRAWIFFQDETGFSQQPSVRRTWAPRGKTPILRSRGNHWTKTSVAAALGFRWDGRQARLFARTKPDSFNTESLIAFLKELKRFVKGAKVILIWDHLPAHRSRVMKRFLFEQKDWLAIEWLPGYAPDLNPTEGVWNNIKGRELANYCADQIEQAAHEFRRGLRRVAHTVQLPYSLLQHAGLFF